MSIGRHGARPRFAGALELHYDAFMSERPIPAAQSPEQAQFIARLALIGGVWVASDIGYYLILPWLGLPLRYGTHPVSAAVYYGVWVVVALVAFRPLYRDWTPFEHRPAVYFLVALALAAVAVFTVYALPLLPPVHWPKEITPPDLLFATPWYFLPKSIEILFQQLLIVAMVLAFSVNRCRMKSIALCAALLFGGMHLLLALSEVPVVYVIRFTVAATVFGYVFPYLILRVRNGFAYSYFTHWGYYAVTLVMVHTISPYAT